MLWYGGINVEISDATAPADEIIVELSFILYFLGV